MYFHSHIDGHKLFMGPEESMRIQSHLGSTIAMAFDECPSARADHEYVQMSVDRTTRWLERCIEAHKKSDTQALFGIIQGSMYPDLRKKSADAITSFKTEWRLSRILPTTVMEKYNIVPIN